METKPLPKKDNYMKENLKDEENTKEKFKSEIETFCAQTTAHGVSHIAKKNAVASYKICWIIIITGALFGNIIHLYRVINDYIKYPSQETVHVLKELPVFPDVTVCNLNPYSKIALGNLYQDPDNEVLRHTRLLDSTRGDLDYFSQTTGVDFYTLLKQFRSFIGNISNSTAYILGHTLENFIAKCIFMDTSCYASRHWKAFVHTTFGRCYTYSVSDNAIYSGAEAGLSLTVAMENIIPGLTLFHSDANYYSNVENGNGVRVIIHEPGSLANPENSGIDIIPGTSTSIGLRMTSIKKLRKPHGECTNKKKLSGLERYTYTTQACTDICLSKYVGNKCGCLNDFRPPQDELANLKSCYYFDNITISLEQFNETYFCMNNMQMNFIRDQSTRDACNCDESCEYPVYDITTSQSEWPVQDYVFSIYEHLVSESLRYRNRPPLFWYFMNAVYEQANGTNDTAVQGYFASLMKSNFARVNVYFESLNVLERKQEPSITLADLFANIGGTIGLWAGLSIITVIEFGFFLFNLTTMKCKCKKATVKPEP